MKFCKLYSAFAGIIFINLVGTLSQVNGQQHRPFNSRSPFFTQSNYQQPDTGFDSKATPAVRAATGITCPETNGRFPTRTCDSYIECVDGIGEEKTCPDGLLFNDKVGPYAFPCQYPIDVDCTNREQTQPPQPTDECPHQYGYYGMGDAQACGQFKNCVDGKAFIFDCPEGLAFNSDTYRCDWPDMVPSCDSEAYLGFKCPPEARDLGPQGFQYFRSNVDCQHYFICIKSKPRLFSCGEGKAFFAENNTCEDSEYVPGCAPSVVANDQLTNSHVNDYKSQPFQQTSHQASYSRQQNNNYQARRTSYFRETTPSYYSSSRSYRNY